MGDLALVHEPKTKRHLGLTLPVTRSTGKKLWKIRNANLDKLSASTEKNIPIILWYGILVDQAHSRYTRLILKTAVYRLR